MMKQINHAHCRRQLRRLAVCAAFLLFTFSSAIRFASQNDSPSSFYDSPLHQLVFEMGQLEQRQLAHGTFFFGPHSHEALDFVARSRHDPPSNDSGLFYLPDDNDIDIEREKERCARYDFKIANEMHPKRRRLFLGSLLADDSMEVLRATGTEVYNICHTVSFVESNTTQSLTPRKWKYYDPTDPPDDLIALHRLFGPRTRVSVEYYVSALKETFGIYGLGVEYVQREGSTHRWAFNGMRGDDVGIISDTDEVFTRDFLRAMQICDIPEFRPNQDCLNPKVIASTMVFESRSRLRDQGPKVVSSRCHFG